MQQEYTPSLNDKAYLTAVYRQYSPALLAYLYRHLRSLEDAEDLLLDVFLAALERQGFEGLGTKEQEAWLWCVARNKITDHYRKRKHRQNISLEFVPDEDYGQDSMTPEIMLLHKEEAERLQAHIERLPAHQQELVRLRFAHGLRSTEIATIVQKSEGAVRTMLSRAIKLLRKVYENE
ncbi:RNA polymerase sigma factor [Ktedonospora formicarum]|uniref:RNA polymerase sigma24 factor n=1 Tax=Ktedonospora formicarum TaxID=2778364 RepID=A0A8J3ICZ6_9CHLR|nr:RNA polymerase sigma factor [Ktedonospora formicarum]GHO50925.1 RNA polymerase sigma24 factor [Ktedonospora formicarum]